MRVLLVEDETKLAGRVCETLTAAHFVADHADCIETAHTLLRACSTYDAAVLDLSLPDGNGLDLIAPLRQRGVGILVLTARDSVEDRVRGLDRGADDYLVKPFAGSELVARLRALMRRPGARSASLLTAGNIAFDTTTLQVSVEAEPLLLPRHELLALEILVRQCGQVVTRERMVEHLYGIDDDPPINAVAVHIHHLRRRLEAAGAVSKIITFRGLGYMLEAGAGTR